MISVKCRQLTKTFERNGVSLSPIRDFDFEMPAGEICALIGRSGCGKTTLLRMLAGLEAPTLGRIGFANEKGEAVKPRLSVVFQEHRLFPWMSVTENIRVAVRDLPREEQERRLADVLDLIGLAPFAGAYPDELSGGMSQRVGFARALVSEPDLLLLDEPFSALDALTRHQLYREFIDIYLKRPMTVLLITHDVAEAVLLSRHIWKLNLEGDAGRYEVDEAYPRHLSTPGVTALTDEILDSFYHNH